MGAYARIVRHQWADRLASASGRETAAKAGLSRRAT